MYYIFIFIFLTLITLSELFRMINATQTMPLTTLTFFFYSAFFVLNFDQIFSSEGISLLPWDLFIGLWLYLYFILIFLMPTFRLLKYWSVQDIIQP